MSDRVFLEHSIESFPHMGASHEWRVSLVKFGIVNLKKIIFIVENIIGLLLPICLLFSYG